MAAFLQNTEPSCAICNAPPSGVECPHESQSLERALDQAYNRWTGIELIRQWVLQQARNQVIESFNQLKAARLQAHIRYLQTLPCFTLYQKYDNPPLTPPQLATLQHQMAQAKSIFQGGIDEDWRRCLQKYPEVLDYYFSLVQIDFPSAEDLVLREPRFGEHMRDPKRLKARRGSMDADAGHKKKSGRRRSRGRTPPAAPMAGHYRR